MIDAEPTRNKVAFVSVSIQEDIRRTFRHKRRLDEIGPEANEAPFVAPPPVQTVTALADSEVTAEMARTEAITTFFILILLIRVSSREG
ncbi:MAG: hypothetical protein V5B35_07490 [Candidatus Accumulibacter necessarius]